MRVVIQRVTEASVTANGMLSGSITNGLLVLLGIEINDTLEDVEWTADKVVRQRLFSDEEGLMNLSLTDVNGSLLIISQFTLHASTKKGNRPSFIKAARPEAAIPLYEAFIKRCKSMVGNEKVQSGIFGADMKVSLLNDGPVTIIIDSKNRE